MVFLGGTIALIVYGSLYRCIDFPAISIQIGPD